MKFAQGFSAGLPFHLLVTSIFSVICAVPFSYADESVEFRSPFLLDDAPVTTLPDFTFSCEENVPFTIYQGEALPSKVVMARLMRDSGRLTKRVTRSIGKRKRAAQRKLRSLQRELKSLKRKSHACITGESRGGEQPPHGIMGLSLSGSLPSPNAQNEVVVSLLPQNGDGSYRFGILGAGFISGQKLKARIGARALTLAHTVESAGELSLRIPGPYSGTVEFTVEQQAVLGPITSNSLIINFISHPSVGEVGDHVATLQQDTPVGVSTFTVSATIPVPPGTYTMSDELNGISPLAIEDGGEMKALQVSGITKYPNFATDGYDVVQVVGRVSTQTTGTSSYRVFRATTPVGALANNYLNARDLVLNAPIELHPSVEALFSAPGKMMAEAEDVFGNRYSCDLTENEQGSIKVFEYGKERLSFRVFCMTLPDTVVPGAQGTLPHLMGILGYFVVNAQDEGLRLTLVTTNSIAGSPLHNGDPRATAFRDLFYRSLNLKIHGVFDTAWVWDVPQTQATTVQNGVTTVAIAPARGDGKMHFIRERWEIPYEFALHTRTPGGVAVGSHLASYRDMAFTIPGVSVTTPTLKLYSPHNPATARFGITPSIWPTLGHLGVQNVRNSLTNIYNTTKNYIRSGKCPLLQKYVNGSQVWVCNYPYLGGNQVQGATTTSPQAVPLDAPHLGPWGATYGGMTGGSEIRPGGHGADRWAVQSREGLLENLLYMNSRMLRQEILRKLDGEPLSPLDAVRSSSAGAFVPVRAFGGYNPSYCGNCDSLFGFLQAPTAHENYVLSNALQPPYYSVMKAYMAEDEQHKIRTTNGIFAAVQLMAHPRAIDNAVAEGHYSYFTNPDLPAYYQGSNPVFLSGGLPGFRNNAGPGLGSSVGRAFAHTQAARVMGYALGSEAYRAFLLPYHEYVANDIMAWSQMWSGLIQKIANFAKTSPQGRCHVSVAREERFLAIGNAATYHRVLNGVSPAAATLKNVIIDNAASILIQDYVLPQNNFFAPWVNVMVSHESAPNTIFTSWAEVPPLCKADVSSPDAGEYHLVIAPADELEHVPALWSLLRQWIQKSNPAPGTTLQKLQTISLYNLQTTNNIANLGRCQVMEGVDPGYCN